jgi:hypothetical protein
MAITKLVADSLGASAVPNQSAFKNIIINGDMSIAQRGTSATGKTSNGYYTVDRFQAVITSQGTWTHAQSTDVPTGQGFAKSLKIDCTTADASPAASDKLQLRQKIEGQNLQYLKKGTSSAESLTLSFWVRSNKTGTYIAEIFDTDNSRQISQSYTISSADTWEKKTLTFAGDTTGTLNNDNGDSFECVFWLGAGSNFTSGTLSTTWTSNTDANRAVGQVNLADSTSNEWYVTGVQLEAGTSASDFEFLPHDVNRERCLRYLQIIGKGDGNVENVVMNGYNSSLCYGNFQLEKKMRTTPSVTFPTTNTQLYNNGAARTISNLAVGSPSASSASFDITGSGWSGGESLHLNSSDTTNGFMKVESEL